MAETLFQEKGSTEGQTERVPFGDPTNALLACLEGDYAIARLIVRDMLPIERQVLARAVRELGLIFQERPSDG